MARRVPDNFESGIGDITEVMSSQGVSDLSWLDVNEEDYRALEALPKQNLDIIPEVQSALSWDGKDPRVPEVHPLRPHTTVNRNPLDNPEATLRTKSSVPNRLAAYLIAGLPDVEISKRLRLEFSPEQLQASHAEASALIAEKGLLGNVYIDSRHFPRCAQEGPHREFVAKSAKRALFVLAKDSCGNCVCNKSGSCTAFKKRLTAEVPYGQKLAAHYVPKLSSENRITSDEVRAAIVSPDAVRSSLQAAFLRPVASRPVEVPQRIQQRAIPKAPVVTESDVQGLMDRQAAAADADRMPGPMYLVAARRMMHGAADVASLRASSDAEVRGLASQHGLLGHTYLDGDALGGVRKTWAFIRERGSSPDFVILRSVSAADASTPEMAQLSSSTQVVRRRPELGVASFASALERAVAEGRVTHEQSVVAQVNLSSLSQSFGLEQAIAEINLASAKAEDRPADYQPAQAGTFFYGDTSGERHASVVDPEEVRRTISHMMNTGLSGRRLQAAILSRYTRAELHQVASLGSELSKDDGVQGTYFIDPTAYADYGRGCKVGGDQFRKLNPVQHVLAASGCTGCSCQTHPGWCSRYSKTLIRQVPETVRQAAEERRRLPVVVETAPIRNPVAEFGLESSLAVEVAPKPRPSPEISVPSQPIPD